MFPIRAAATFFTALALLASPVLAADAPPHTDTLVVFVDTLKVIEVGGDIHTVVVANPDVADASVASPRKLFLLGKKPGHTSLLITDGAGNALFDASVMVAPDQQGVVTINRGATKEATLSCAPRCQALILQPDSGPGAAAAAGAGAGAQPPSSSSQPPPGALGGGGSGLGAGTVPGGSGPVAPMPGPILVP
jgi:Flp pilus assembly secretin CpaC